MPNAYGKLEKQNPHTIFLRLWRCFFVGRCKRKQECRVELDQVCFRGVVFESLCRRIMFPSCGASWHRDLLARCSSQAPPTLTRKGQGHGHFARVLKIVEPTSPRPCYIRGSHASNVPSGPRDQPPCNVKCNIYSIGALATTFAALVAPALSKSFQRNLQPNTIEFRAHQLRQRPLPRQSTLDSHSTKATDLLMIWPC